MSLVKTNQVQLGQSGTATQNFTLAVPSPANGTVKLARGNAGATTQDVLTVDANGNIDGNVLATGTTFARSLATRAADIVNVKDFGAVGDGIVNDTAAIQLAINYCVSNNTSLYWPAGNYVSSSNLTSFWSVSHEGDGRIIRGSDTWYIEPKNNQTNIIHISPTGSSGNDGFSSSQSVNIATAFNRIKSLGSESQDGIWRLQFSSGTYTDSGVTLENLPYFKNALQIYGANVNETTSTVPTTIWDGATSGASYAIRIDASVYPSTSEFFEIKNIKFINWTVGGGIVAHAHGNGRFVNIHTDNCRIGIWGRYGYFKFNYGRIENSSVWGIGVQYNASCNIGNLTGGGITFDNCETAISIGRFTVGYIEGNNFSNATSNYAHIKCEWMARVRPQKNTFDNTASFVVANGNSLFTDEVASVNSNIFPASISEAKPYARSLAGSVIPDISKYSQKTLHNYSGNTLEQGLTPINLFNVTTTDEILLSNPLYGGSDFVPFRIPAYTLYSPTFEFEISLGISLNANAGGRLEFHGQGAATANEFCNLYIPQDSTFRTGFVKIRVFNIPGSALARFEISYPPANLYKTGSTPSLNVPEIRGNSAQLLLYRLYWQSDTTDQVTIYSMRTYITE
jgi:hypothetical protein